MVQRKNRNWIGYNKNDQVLMAVFLYNLHIFVWTSHSDLTYIPGLCVYQEHPSTTGEVPNLASGDFVRGGFCPHDRGDFIHLATLTRGVLSTLSKVAGGVMSTL